MDDYSKKVMEHFRNPKNMGKLDNPDGIGKITNPVCGDATYIYIKVDKKNGKEYIPDIKFQTMGCVAAISTSSILTEVAKGLHLDEAMKLKSKDITEALSGLPKPKEHCSLLALDALKEAIKDYKVKQK